MSEAESQEFAGVEREELICDRCGLVWQQQTESFDDASMHGACPRCGKVVA